MKLFFTFTLLFVSLNSFAIKIAEIKPEAVKNVAVNPVVEIDTSMGTIEVELNQAKAPITVNNFLRYVDEGFYNGTIFHRVIKTFMIQGGGFNEKMEQKPTHETIQNEATNGLTNDIGTIAMARLPEPHSATAQFFINVADNDSLNHKNTSDAGYGYAVFGKVTSGMHVVERIKQVRTGPMNGHGDVPMDKVIIKSIKRKEAPKV